MFGWNKSSTLYRWKRNGKNTLTSGFSWRRARSISFAFFNWLTQIASLRTRLHWASSGLSTYILYNMCVFVCKCNADVNFKTRRKLEENRKRSNVRVSLTHDSVQLMLHENLNHFGKSCLGVTLERSITMVIKLIYTLIVHVFTKVFVHLKFCVKYSKNIYICVHFHLYLHFKSRDFMISTHILQCICRKYHVMWLKRASVFVCFCTRIKTNIFCTYHTLRYSNIISGWRRRWLIWSTCIT